MQIIVDFFIPGINLQCDVSVTDYAQTVMFINAEKQNSLDLACTNIFSLAFLIIFLCLKIYVLKYAQYANLLNEDFPVM